ncbi:MAG: IS1182 family transposase [Prevotella sp.]
MTDTSKNILLSDVQGQGFLSIFNDLSSELMPHELSLLELMEGLDYDGFDSTLRRDASVDPKDMAMIVVYSYMMGCTSSRSIERLCRRDLFIIAVLKGVSAPDHTTVNRFIKRNGSQIEDMFYQVVNKLGAKGELGRETVFQDGTKIESRAGKYTFVWKNFVSKNAEKCEARLRKCLRSANSLGLSILCEESVEFPSVYTELMAVKERIEGMKLKLDAPTGKGIRLDPRVRLYRKLTEDLKKIRDYDETVSAIGEKRNSMSKTDPDATFMRMKEDAMGNGQLKPAYNLQCASDSNYIVGCTISCDRTDYETCVPMMEKLEEKLSWKYSNYCADSGYDTVRNFNYLEENGYTPYIKPQDWEVAKTRRYMNDIGKYQNMEYNKDDDIFICANGKKIVKVDSGVDKKSGSSYGAYRCCESCQECPLKEKCMKSSKKDRKEFQAYMEHWELRNKARILLESDKGVEIRVNRSIMAEGSFAQMKSNNKLRRFASFGRDRAFTEWILMALAVNVKHYANRRYNYNLDDPDWYEKKPA